MSGREARRLFYAFNQLKSELENHQAQLQTKRQELTDSSSLVTSLRSELENQQVQLQTTRQETFNWANRTFSLRSELKNYQTQLQTTRQELTDSSSLVTSLRSELENHQAQLQITRQDLTDSIGKISYLRNSRETRIHAFVAEALSLAAPLTMSQMVYENKIVSGSLTGKFTKFGSDKEIRHNYAQAYIEILSGVTAPHILEIGLGSLNGYPYGGIAPGGSIKAWREAYPDSLIVGADIDPESVAAISEIGFVIDQTSDESLNKFVHLVAQYAPFDIVVDDGFHDPHANFRTLFKVFPLVKESGAYVIEDIHQSLIDFWRVIASTLDADLEVRDLREDRPNVEDNILLIFRKRVRKFN